MTTPPDLAALLADLPGDTWEVVQETQGPDAEHMEPVPDDFMICVLPHQTITDRFGNAHETRRWVGGIEASFREPTARALVALRNAAPGLLAELVALRAKVAGMEGALANCRAIAAREGARTRRRSTHEADRLPWDHVLRFCREAGVVGSVLREDALPGVGA
jgi:hypothetical protein